MCESYSKDAVSFLSIPFYILDIINYILDSMETWFCKV